MKFVEAYAAAGVPVDAVTLQNEPEFAPGGYPGMLFSPADQATFIIHLGPALRAAGLSTKILAFDHNWDLSSYAKTVLNNTNAAQYVAGTAFHCYGGDPSAQSDVHDVAPSKNVYLTECSGGDWSPDFGANLNWGIGNLAIGATRNWAKTALLLWNLALDTRGGPTNGGCTNCRGVVTVDPSSGAVDYNVDYHVLGAFSKVVQPGAVRIDSSTLESIGVQNVAFQNPDGSYALVALNWGKTAQSVSVNADGRSFDIDPRGRGGVVPMDDTEGDPDNDDKHIDHDSGAWDSLVRLAGSDAGWPSPPPADTWAADPDGLAGGKQ